MAPTRFGRGALVATPSIVLLVAMSLWGTAAATAAPGLEQPTGCRGIEVTPADAPQLPSIVQDNPPDSVFCLDAGTFRISEPIAPKSGDVLRGVSSSTTTGTILRGDTVLMGWPKVSGLRQHVGDAKKIYSRQVPCADGTKVCQYSDWLFQDDLPLRRVLSPCTTANVVTGTFCIDYDLGTIYMFDNPNGHTISYATVEQAILPDSDVRIQHLAIGWFANTPQGGAALAVGTSSTATDVNVLYTHATGAFLFGPGATIENSHLHLNGAKGVGGSGDGQFFLDNEVDGNNNMGYDANQDAGGAKFTGATNLTVSGNYVHDNHGNGLWFDADVGGATVTDNTSVRNLFDSSGGGDGIRIEKSCFITMTGNALLNNDKAGIGTTNSHDLTIGVAGDGNRLSGNDSFAIRIAANGWDRPALPNCHPDGGVYQITNNVVTDNSIRMPEDSSVGIWGIKGVSIAGSSYGSNTYRLGHLSCKGTMWQWWDGSKAVVVKFSTWQGTYDQDVSGKCKGKS